MKKLLASKSGSSQGCLVGLKVILLIDLMGVVMVPWEAIFHFEGSYGCIT